LALNLSEGRKSGGKTDPKGRIPHQQANRTKLPEQYTRPSFLTLPGVEFPSARWRKDGFCYHDRLRLKIQYGGGSLAEVRLQEGESIDSALRRFKRKVQTEDIIKEVKRHSFYLKPGAKRRVKQALARKRARKKMRREPD